MAKRKRTSKRSPRLNLDRFKSYEERKAFALAHPNEFTPQQSWAIVERMRQLRYGYKPGKLRMDRKNVKIEFLTLEQFRANSELEYQEEIRKYGPR